MAAAFLGRARPGSFVLGFGIKFSEIDPLLKKSNRGWPNRQETCPFVQVVDGAGRRGGEEGRRESLVGPNVFVSLGEDQVLLFSGHDLFEALTAALAVTDKFQAELALLHPAD